MVVSVVRVEHEIALGGKLNLTSLKTETYETE